jgi:hypothetical protein
MPSLSLLCVFATIKISSNDDWASAGREGDCDVVALLGRSFRAPGSSLVTTSPLGWESGPKPHGASLRILHPGQQSLPRFRLQNVTSRNSPDELRHRQGRGGIAKVSREHQAQIGFISVEPGDGVAHFAKFHGDGGWTAQAFDKKVGGNSIAQFLRRLRQFRYAHAASGEILARHRRPRQKIGFGIGQNFIKINSAPVRFAQGRAAVSKRRVAIVAPIGLASSAVVTPELSRAAKQYRWTNC